MKQSDILEEAGSKLLKLNEDDYARQIAQDRADSEWAWQHTLHATEERAHAEGVEQGQTSKAIEIAKSLLQSNMAIEDVSKHASLPLAAVKELL